MILRMWKGQSTDEKAGAYARYATQTVFPKLRKIEGHRGAYLLRRPISGGVEFVVLTLWDSMESVHKFAGADADKAVVEPEAQSFLSGFDDFVTHFDVVNEIEQPRG
jgi:heme-degrading monooxygenase HmoA